MEAHLGLLLDGIVEEETHWERTTYLLLATNQRSQLEATTSLAPMPLTLFFYEASIPILTHLAEPSYC